MDLSSTKIDALALIAVSGEIDAMTAPSLQEALEEQVSEGCYQLVVDLQEVSYISSAGLRVLLGGLKATRRSGGDLRLVRLQPLVQEVFDIAGFSTLFQIFPNVEGAVDSFAQA